MSENRNGFRASAARERISEATLRRLVPEVRTALDNAPDVRAWPPSWHDDEWFDYFYHSSSLLTRDRDLSRVQDVLRDLGAWRDDAGDSLVGGVTRLGVNIRESQHTPDLVEDLDNRLGTGVATLDHAFMITGYLACPATEPEPVITPAAAEDPVVVRDALWPGVGDSSGGRDVAVSVVDTGLLSRASEWAPWILGVRPDTSADIEDPDQIKINALEHEIDGFADPYAGHGTFVSGVIRCVAPASTVVVERILGVAGFARESRLIQQIHDALTRSPDIISMSAGCYTRKNVPSLAFQALWEERLSQLGGIVLVAAAGNQSETTPFWPAAFPWCVGVGSMTRDGQRRSWFSNHGAWVDVYAPGEDIVNAYAQMKYKTIVDGDVRDTSAGIVKWSGTSFSTPIVTGLIAARMSRTGENARQAADALLAAARGQFRPGVGPRLFP